MGGNLRSHNCVRFGNTAGRRVTIEVSHDNYSLLLVHTKALNEQRFVAQLETD